MTNSNDTKVTVQSQVKSPWTKEQVDLITNTVAKGATPDELKLFLYTASRTKLDPLTKQIHFVKRGGQMTVQTGIDGYRAIAERSGTLAGIDDAVYDSEDGTYPNKATVTVYRMIEGIRVAYSASARWAEYAPQGNQAFMWNKMPYLMLAKCAEALALRKAFPNDLSGVYTNEEMAQADYKAEPVNYNEHVEGAIVPTQPIQTVSQSTRLEPLPENDTQPKKQCPYCNIWHTGSYPKCVQCWRDERAGRTLTPKVKTKTIVNTDEPPFEG